MPGSRGVKGEQVDVKRILKQQAYVDKFREGEWVPLLEYLVEEAGMRASDVDTLAKQMHAAEQAQSMKLKKSCIQSRIELVLSLESWATWAWQHWHGKLR